MNAEAVTANCATNRLSARLRLTVALIAAGLLLLLMVAGGQRWAVGRAARLGLRAAQEMGHTHAGLFASELQKYRLLPLVLTEYPDVRSVLTLDPSAAARLNPKLELLASRTHAAVIYVLDRSGHTVSASNWRLPTSFVGHDYGFRAYFREALRVGNAEQLALGAVSQRPGLFLARRIVAGRTVLGVIVVKVEFDALEAVWRRQPGPTLVTDAQGIVVMTSRPDWRFRAAEPMTAAVRAELQRSRQFGGSPLTPLPIRSTGGGRFVDADGQRYMSALTAIPIPGWNMRYLAPLAPLERAAFAQTQGLVTAVGLPLILVFVLAIRVYEKRALQLEGRRFLEREVERRTVELRTANEQLRLESIERERVDGRLRAAREELAQANRLGSLGQITAGVAHEINQPVAAIRTFAENATQLLARGDSGRARGNLDNIVDLTSRIGWITAELRSFARRGTPPIGAVPLESAVAGALLLLGDRLRVSGVDLCYSGAAESDLAVIADRVRLEQIFINLLQNALDALEEVLHPAIGIDIVAGRDVVVTISDNGPGLPCAIVDQLFTPFVTAKPNGLGLGLGIARDIVREFGGELTMIPSAVGAAFAIRLKRP